MSRLVAAGQRAGGGIGVSQLHDEQELHYHASVIMFVLTSDCKLDPVSNGVVTCREQQLYWPRWYPAASFCSPAPLCADGTTLQFIHLPKQVHGQVVHDSTSPTFKQMQGQNQNRSCWDTRA